jgi:hypothetical protein
MPFTLFLKESLMKRVKVFYCAGLVGLALFLVMFVVGGLMNVQAATAVSGPSQRSHDPVIVSGADLPAFDQVPINELRLYIYDGVDWQPIPMQIDERVVVSNTAVYTTFEDGLLDANDELVFMGHDSGTVVLDTNWVNNPESLGNPRYALAVADPLQPSKVGYAYLYHASTLAASMTSYVAWDDALQTLTALSYTLSFDPNNFIGVADLRINGNAADILDRQKVRVVVDPPVFPPVTLTEEDIPGLLGIPVTVTLPIVGPVRAIGGGGSNEFAFYGRRSDLRATLDLDSIELPIPGTTFEELRTSFDLNDPATTGMTPTLYYDSNTPTGVAVDGSMDAIPNSPLLDWYEISGNSGGFVAIAEASAETGTLTNYYVDDNTPNANDTGDGLSFADTGVHIANPGGTLTVTQALYIISPNVSSQGSMIKDWYDNPLQVVTAVQNFPAEQVYLPFIER